MNTLRLVFFLACYCRLAACIAAVFQVDSANSTAYFEVGYFGHGLVKGALNRISGTVELDDASKDGKAEINFDMTTVETGHGMTNRFIKSKSIFYTALYPAMMFRATRFDFQGDQLMSVNGDLLLHGVTRAIRLEAKRFACDDKANPSNTPNLPNIPNPSNMPNTAQTCNGEFATVIYRSHFGMDRFSFMVNDDVLINVTLTLERLQPH